MDNMVVWCMLLIAIPGISGIVCALLPDRASRIVATFASLATE